MSRTTIAIHEDTRQRIKTGAAAAAKTIDAYLRDLLDERENRDFWASLDDVTPESYAAAVVADGDQLDEGYADEDNAISAAER